MTLPIVRGWLRDDFGNERREGTHLSGLSKLGSGGVMNHLEVSEVNACGALGFDEGSIEDPCVCEAPGCPRTDTDQVPGPGNIELELCLRHQRLLLGGASR